MVGHILGLGTSIWILLWSGHVEIFIDDATIFGEESKGMELAVILSLFASRVQEIRVTLQVLSHAFAYFRNCQYVIV